jgi:hypothetical protein
MAYDIARKLAAMVAKAESTTSTEEADSIMQMVRHMLNRHGLSLLSISTAAMDDPVAVEKDLHSFWQAEGWMGNLTGAAARFFGCRIVFSRSGNKTWVTIAGRESCRAAYQAMMPYLRHQVKRNARIEFQAGRYASQSQAERAIANALTYRLQQLWAENERKTRSPGEARGLMALVPVDTIQAALEAEFGQLRARRASKRRTDRNAINVAAGISLADQVGASERKQLS